MLIIECPFCGKLEEREFRHTNRDVKHSIPCDECKIIDKGRMTIVHMLTALSVLLGTNRKMLTGEYVTGLHALALQAKLKEALREVDLYLDEIPF